MMRTRAAILTLVLMHAPLSLLAAEDGGTQSVFAMGAGNRALGMGAAFVAAADDASAVLWNPAGLGGLRRSEFQAVQSGDLGAGFRESYASLAIPNWRLGTFGLVFRHFGVDGVEQRDDRNVVVGEDLSDSEMEMALGYGRMVGDAWKVGGALKLQRQNVAGFGGSGIGADLGMTVKPGMALGMDAPWTDQWTWGLTIRNVIEPSIRLDQESVPDPTAIRAGIAYQAPMRLMDWLLVEVDVEKTRGVGARLRAGMEYRFMGVAAMRLGINGSRMAAGTALQWRGGSLDYAFENGELQSSHRFGLTLPFGASVTESRLAAEAAEDQELQEKLAEAFRERQRQQIDGLIVEARTRLRRGDIDGALDAVAAIATLDPENPVARELRAACHIARAGELEDQGDFAAAAVAYESALKILPDDPAAIEGVKRARAESDLRAARTQEIRELFRKGMDAFVAGDLITARNGFRAVLERDPGDDEVRRMLARTDTSIERNASELLEQARRLVSNGLFDEAEALITRVAALDPTSRELARVRNTFAQARRAALAQQNARQREAAQAAGTAQASPAPALTERQLAALYEQGRQAMQKGQSDEAVRYWEIVWSAQPSYRQVGSYLSREYLTRGMEAFAAGRIEEAIERWKRVLTIDSDNARAKGYLERAQKQMARSREILGAGD